MSDHEFLNTRGVTETEANLDKSLAVSLWPDKAGDNNVFHYLPVTTKTIREKNDPIDYSKLSSALYGVASGNIPSNKITLESFEKDCRKQMLEEIHHDYAEDICSKLLDHYLDRNRLLDLAPDFAVLWGSSLLYTNEAKLPTQAKTLLELAGPAGFLRQSNSPREQSVTSRHPFFTSILLESLRRSIKSLDGSGTKVYEKAASGASKRLTLPGENTQPYLPFLRQRFRQDLAWILAQPRYLSRKYELLLRLYLFLYSSQLALNAGLWCNGEPVCQSLYFILDTEKASRERVDVYWRGYKKFRCSVQSLIPAITLVNYFRTVDNNQVVPIWQFYESLKDARSGSWRNFCDNLPDFLQKYTKSRLLSLPDPEEYTTPKQALRLLIDLAAQSFRQSRNDPLKKLVAAFDNVIGAGFIQSRGNFGRALVINQDTLLLLTNLAIGERHELRFQELLGEFKSRGVWFDATSNQALLAFYSRIGNVKKLSDSGDAVYVSKVL